MEVKHSLANRHIFRSTQYITEHNKSIEIINFTLEQGQSIIEEFG